MARIPTVYWDSCVWIGLINQEPDKFAKVAGVLDRARAGELQIVTSTFTIAEVVKRKCGAEKIGGSTTSIFSGVASKAGLKVVSKTNVISTTHTVPANVYLGDLWIRATYIGGNHEFPLYDRQFIELIQANPNFDALLGMDVFFWSSLIVGAVAILFALKNLSHLGDFNDAPRNDRLCGVLTAGWKRLRAGLRRAGRQD